MMIKNYYTVLYYYKPSPGVYFFLLIFGGRIKENKLNLILTFKSPLESIFLEILISEIQSLNLLYNLRQLENIK